MQKNTMIENKWAKIPHVLYYSFIKTLYSIHKIVRKIIRLAVDPEYENYIVYIYIKKLESEFIHSHWKVLYNTTQYDNLGWYQKPPHLI